MSTTGIYVYIGLEAARKGSGPIPQPYPDSGDGHLGVTDRCEHFAGLVDAWVAQDDGEYPGVFEYEIVEELGSWLFHNFGANDDELKQQIVERTALWRVTDRLLR